MEHESMQEMKVHIKSLRRQVRFFYLFFGAAIIFLAATYAGDTSQASGEMMDKSDKVIRARGLILLDEQGR